jgi:hypothetical protein
MIVKDTKINAIRTRCVPDAIADPTDPKIGCTHALLFATFLSLGEHDAGELGQFGDEPVLEFRIGGLARWLLPPETVPVASADLCCRLVADGQPGLGPLPGVEVDRSSSAAHSRARPAGVDGIAQDLRPASREREGQRDDVQLASA